MSEILNVTKCVTRVTHRHTVTKSHTQDKRVNRENAGLLDKTKSRSGSSDVDRDIVSGSATAVAVLCLHRKYMWIIDHRLWSIGA